MEKRKSILNIGIGLIARVIVLGITVITRSFLVRQMGPSINGLFSLFTDILGFLSIANLGVGTAITYSMYKPIIEKDLNQVSALFHTYKKFYRIIFAVILMAGIALLPFLSLFTNEIPAEINIYFSYMIFLVAVLLSYLYAHKTSLVNAYKDNYLTTIIHSSSMILQGVIQIVVIITTKSFLLFLLVAIITNLIEFLFTEIVYKKKYKSNINDNKILNKNLKDELKINIKSMFLSRIGSKMTSALDGIIIGIYISVIALGRYSNYVTIIGSMIAVLQIIFSEITAIIGHKYVVVSKGRYYDYFIKSYIINFIIAIVFFLGFYAVSNDIVRILFGESEIIGLDIIQTATIAYFMYFMNKAIELYKTSSGLFFEDRYRPLVEGVIKIILSIILIEHLGIVGVLLATIITRAVVSFTYEPFILFKKRFSSNVVKFYPFHYMTIIVLVVTMMIFDNFFRIFHSNEFLSLLFNGVISLILSFTTISLLFVLIKPLRKEVLGLMKIVSTLRKKRR